MQSTGVDLRTRETLMDLRPPGGLEAIDAITEGYQVYQTLIAALDLGLFEFLRKQGPSDRDQVADGIAINGMFGRSLLNALVEMGALSVEEDRYSITDMTRAFLVGDSPFYQGNRIRGVSSGGHWDKLADSLKCGQQDMAGFNLGPSEAFIRALAEDAVRGELQAVTKAVVAWEGFQKARKLLDLGGGHGLYAIALCQENPVLSGVVLDKPHVIDTTREFIDRYGMQERLSAQGGDICADGLGSGYDIVLVSHLLYKFRKELGRIFARIGDCINPGGLLVTNHWFCRPGCAAEDSAIRELGIALHSFGHPLCHVEDFERRLGENGFKVIMTGEAPSSQGTTLFQLAVKVAAR